MPMEEILATWHAFQYGPLGDPQRPAVAKCVRHFLVSGLRAARRIGATGGAQLWRCTNREGATRDILLSIDGAGRRSLAPG
jgi:hypothetical protein